MKLTELEQIIEKSAFNKQRYEVNIPVRRFISSIMDYIDPSIENPTFQNILKKGIPIFQRSNDQWTRQMQVKFVENVVKVFVPKIQLFEIKGKRT